MILTVRFVYDAWYAADRGWVDANLGSVTVGAHAVLGVGRLDDPDAVVIKNSWGTGWGQAGVGALSAGYLNAYGVSAYSFERIES